MPAMWGLAIEVPLRMSDWLPAMMPVAAGLMQPVVVVPLQVLPVCAEVMETPGAVMSGFRAYGVSRRGPREEKLARVSAAVNRVTLRPGMLALKVLPSAKVTITEGMVIVASTPPMLPKAPAAELAMITATAPAFCAFLTLTTKPQVPRSIRAMLPAIAAALVSGEQPSVVEGPAASAGSRPITTLPVRPAGGGGPPKAAVPAT